MKPAVPSFDGVVATMLSNAGKCQTLRLSDVQSKQDLGLRSLAHFLSSVPCQRCVYPHVRTIPRTATLTLRHSSERMHICHYHEAVQHLLLPLSCVRFILLAGDDDFA